MGLGRNLFNDLFGRTLIKTSRVLGQEIGEKPGARKFFELERTRERGFQMGPLIFGHIRQELKLGEEGAF